MKEELRRAWRESGEFYSRKNRPVKQRSRNYHIAMVVIDGFLAGMFAVTVVGIPLAMLFAYSAFKRYDKYLK